MIFFCRIERGDLSIGGVIAAVLITLVALLVAPAALWGGRRTLRRLVVGCAIFQAGHFSEHMGQMFGLLGTGDLTVTWWAREIIYGYAALFGRSAEVGLEAMHFFGDAIYLAGVVAWWRLRGDGLGQAAMAVQSVHQGEHLSLVLSTLLLGEPVGLTTIENVPLRITLHFLLNFGGSALWACSVARWWAARPWSQR